MGRPKNPLNTLKKICPVCQMEFECEKRKEKTYCSKQCSANSDEVKEKNRTGVMNTFKLRYGGHPMATNTPTIQKLNATVKEKYGKEWFSQTPKFEEAVKSTKKNRYGNENYNNLDKMKATMLEKYGVENYRKTEECKKKYSATCLEKYGKENYSQTTEYKNGHKLQMFEKFLSSDRFKNFTVQFSIDEYQGVTKAFNKKYPFKCNRCQRIEDHYLSDGKKIKCSHCDKTTSEFQLSVFDYIKSLLPNDPIVNDDRTALYPQEIDIYLPNKKIGIECDGLYWHTEISGSKNKNYHLNKTKLASTKGIRLIHIFENEWNDKQEIVKSILKNILTRTNKIIYARDCVIKEVTPNSKKKFLNENHIQGNDHASIKLGLYHKEELISVMTFTKSRFDKTVEWEMSRFCSKINHTVIGGSSKLLKHFIHIHKPKTIVSYSDRRYFSGEVYLKMGFTFVDNTPPNYFYTTDGYCTLSGRQGWQKHRLSNRLEKFDSSLSEWNNMKMNGFDRIWDCGNIKWVLKVI